MLNGVIGKGTWALVIVVASAGTAAAATRKAAPAKYAPVRVACPEALEDGTPTDGSVTEALLAAAAAVPWTRADGPPSTCHRTVRLTCGPDLDGDGDPEAIVELQGWTGTDDAPCDTLKATEEHWLLTHTFLASRHHGVWRALGRLDAGLSTDDAEPRRAAFVRRAGSGPAIRIDWTSITSESGCRIAGYEILAWRAGALRRLELGDNSRTCSLCDCSR
jgi:hypothetical protein